MKRNTLMVRMLVLLVTGVLSAGLLTGCQSSSPSSSAVSSASSSQDESSLDTSTQDASSQDATSSSDAGTTSAAAETITVVDLAGDSVEVPAQAKHIGALLGNSPSKILFLGEWDRVACSMMLGSSAWYDVIYPGARDKDIPFYEPAGARDPDMEVLADMDIDLVYYWADLEEQKQKMRDLGISVIMSNPSGVDFATVDEWLDLLNNEMDVYAESLNTESAKAKAADWEAYAKETLDMVIARTKDLTDDERPSVYYIRQDESTLQCFAKSSYPLMCVEAAGGNLVTKDVDTSLSSFTEVTMEQIVEWNPDIVFMGWRDSTDAVVDNPAWSSVAAVENGQVYLNPAGTSTGWAYGPEAPLEVLYLAKTMHPDLFTDIDLAQEVQSFYKRFCDVDITLDQANLMLEHKEPEAGNAANSKAA